MTLILHSSSLSFPATLSSHLIAHFSLRLPACSLFLCYCMMCFGTNYAPFLLLGLSGWGVTSLSLLLPPYSDFTGLSLIAEHWHALSLGDIQSESREKFVSREASQKVKTLLTSSGGQQKNDPWKLDCHVSKDDSCPDLGRYDKMYQPCILLTTIVKPVAATSSIAQQLASIPLAWDLGTPALRDISVAEEGGEGVWTPLPVLSSSCCLVTSSTWSIPSHPSTLMQSQALLLGLWSPYRPVLSDFLLQDERETWSELISVSVMSHMLSIHLIEGLLIERLIPL